MAARVAFAKQRREEPGQSVESQTWTNGTVTIAQINASDNTRTGGGRPGDTFTTGLAVSRPADWAGVEGVGDGVAILPGVGQVNRYEMGAEVQITGSVSRDKTVTFQWQTDNDTATLINTSRLYTASQSDAYQTTSGRTANAGRFRENSEFEITLTEGNGMGDSATIELDHLYLDLDYFPWRADHGQLISCEAYVINHSTSAGTAVSVNKPTGLADNDVLVAFIIADDGTVTVADNNGGTSFTEDVDSAFGGSADARKAIYTRAVSSAAGEPSTYNWTLSGSANWSIIILRFSGVDNTNIWDVSPTNWTTPVTSTPTVTGITPTYDGSYLLFFNGADGSGSRNFSHYGDISTYDADYAGRWMMMISSDREPGLGTAPIINIAGKDVFGPGATGNILTPSNTTDSFYTQSGIGALRPAQTSPTHTSPSLTTTGNFLAVAATGFSGSQSTTVPSDAEAVLAFVFSEQSASNDGLEELTLGGVRFTPVLHTDYTSITDTIFVGFIDSPTTGSGQNIAWTWGSAPANGGAIYLVYLKNVNPDNPVRDADFYTNSTGTGQTLTTGASADDMIVTVAYSDQSDIAITGGTALSSGGPTNSRYYVAKTHTSLTEPSTGVAYTLTSGRNAVISVAVRPVSSAGGTQYNENHTFSGVGTSSLVKEVQLNKTYSGVGTQTVNKAVSLFKTFSGVGSSVLTKAAQHVRSFAATALGTAALTKGLLYTRDFVMTAVGTSVLTKTSTFFRAFTNAATGTSALVKDVGKVLAYSATGTSAVIKQVAKSFAVTGVGTSVLTYGLLFTRAFTATATGTSALIKQVSKSFVNTATGTSALVKEVALVAFAATATGTSAVLKTVTKPLAYTATGAVTLAKGLAYNIDATMTAVGSVVLTRATTFARSFSATAVGTSSLVKQVGKVLTFTATGSVAKIRQVGKVLAHSAVGTASLIYGLQYTRAFTMTAVGTVNFTKTLVSIVTAAMTAVGTASLTRAATFNQQLAATATGTVSLIKQIAKAFTAAATGTVTKLRQIGLVRAFTATGAASETDTLQAQRQASMTATGTSVSDQTFVPGGGGGPVAAMFRAFRRLYRSISWRR